MPTLGALMRIAEALSKDAGYARMPERARGVLENMYRHTPATFDVVRPEVALAPVVRGQSMVATTPSQFLRLAPPMDRYADDRVNRFARMLRTPGEKVPNYDPDEYYDKMYPKFGGFGDMPYLMYNAHSTQQDRPFALMTGHEGRHRMEAIKDVYGDVPLTVRASTWGNTEQLPSELSKPWILPETPGMRLSKETIDDPDFIRLFLEHNPRPWRRGGTVR